jgi:transposase InsO family protein
VTATNHQVKQLMNDYSQHGKQSQSALRAGLCRQTGAKYLKSGKLPSELKTPRHWRTRPDPFAEVWPEIEQQLQKTPGLWVPILFEQLQSRYPGQFEPGQIRTLYRRVSDWRALYDQRTDHTVFFPQQHRPGEALQTDFTHIRSLAITIGGEPLTALLCQVVLPYSNWQWATRCQGESFLALKAGIQAAVFRLGKVAQWHQTDNSTGATHRISSGGRGFNRDYLDLMDHLGMKPRTIAVGCKEQNGSVESLNGALKRGLNQQLQLRGSREFATEADFDQWLVDYLHKANSRRQTRFQQELPFMTPLTVSRLPEYKALDCRVSGNSTINVQSNIYSVPPRLIHHTLTVHRFETRLEVYFRDQLIQTMPRLKGRSLHAIDYRHVIHALVKKPQAFARYRYQSSLYPNELFRRAYQRLQQHRPGLQADREYLRLLYLAATESQGEVESALELLLDEHQLPTPDQVRALFADPQPPQPPSLRLPTVQLHSYDELLQDGWL